MLVHTINNKPKYLNKKEEGETLQNNDLALFSIPEG